MRALQVGDRVWLQDDNNRHYEPGHSGPVFRRSFTSRLVVSETKQSWVLDSGLKINKKTGLLRSPNADGSFYGLSARVYRSETEVEDECWARANRYKVAQAVQHCYDAGVLREVAALLRTHGQLAGEDIS
jgi:hypothetical protein